MTEKSKKWSDEAVATLVANMGPEPVTPSAVAALAVTLGVSERSVASKLRQLNHTVASLAKERVATFSLEQSEALSAFVQNNSGQYTYGQIAERFEGGGFSPKQIQGKVLALELTGCVKPTEKVEVARTYSEAEESTFVKMAQAGKFIEEISTTLGKSIASIRGKALSLFKQGQIEKIPAQKETHAKNAVDPVTELGDKINGMTVAEIAAAVGKTDRGLKTLLTRRGIKVADYDGAAKKEKAAGKAADAAKAA